MTTYYVSSEIGNNNNAGTSQNAPLASLQAAANVVKPGDTVQVMNGTYTAPAYGAALDITTSGTANAPITFEAAPGQKPVIDSSGGWNAIDIQASYIVVSGFTVVGDAANYNLQSALAGYGTGNANLNGNGIVVNPSSSVSLPNHITIENNTVSNEPGGGIGIDGADYVQILNNVVHNNANWSAYGTSGITINSSVNLDTNPGPHDIVSGNIVYDNAQLVPSSGVGAITDGEGIILDSNQNYTSEILVENNTVYGNGSAGIESFLTNNATITGNNIYGNNTQNIQSQGNAEILINQSNNNTVTNNTTVNPNVPAPVISNAVVNSNGTVTLTGTAVGGSSVAVWDGGQSALGTATASNTGAWSFTTPDLLPGAYGFTAIDKTAAGGTSAPSVSISATVSTNTGVAAPVISKIAVNSNDSVTLTGTAAVGSTVTVWSMAGDNDGSTTASGSGAWSFTTPDLLPGIYGYTATDTTAAGTSLQSNALGVTVPAAGAQTAPVPGAPVITKGTVNSNDSITLTGTAAGGSTVTVWSGTGTNDGTTTASSTGAWSFTTPDLLPGVYGYTATDTTSGGTSVKSNALGVTVPTATASAAATAPVAPLPTAPSLTNIAVNSNDSITLTGTAAGGSAVTVWSVTGTNDGATTASSTGAWSFTTPVLLPGVYGYTATDTTSGGTSVKSNALGVTVPDQSFSANGHTYGAELNLTATSDELDLTASGVTITRGSGTESLNAGSSVFPFSSSDYRSTETIDAQPGDHFVFNPQFGHETIQGFNALGSNADTLQLSISSFSYLNAGMSQAADLAALLTHSTSGTSSTTITDSSGDTLTLAGLANSTIAADAAANPHLFKFT
jgi:Right handed beta helix region